jgi:hypothetical protein
MMLYVSWYSSTGQIAGVGECSDEIARVNMNEQLKWRVRVTGENYSLIGSRNDLESIPNNEH